MEQEEQQRRRSRRGRGSHRRYAQPNSNFAPSLGSLPDISIPLFSVSLSLSGSAESANAAAENKDREVIIAMVTKAVTAITQRLTSLSTFDGTDSKVRAHEYACRVGGRFATLVLARSGGVAHLLSETQTSVF